MKYIYNKDPFPGKRQIDFYEILNTTEKAILIDSICFGHIWIPKKISIINYKNECMIIPVWLYNKIYNSSLMVS